ncbi:unnamed protein product [Protopolystoma xenopodis]|uniref:Uncharacterized protein n=1 Tax=Protopolystoma xenopodis TaxID=117903 RepID=A0A448WUZ8_9PLAT|nr:unnamed protein product [Protopolystoma xenopodis]
MRYNLSGSLQSSRGADLLLTDSSQIPEGLFTSAAQPTGLLKLPISPVGRRLDASVRVASLSSGQLHLWHQVGSQAQGTHVHAITLARVPFSHPVPSSSTDSTPSFVTPSKDCAACADFSAAGMSSPPTLRPASGQTHLIASTNLGSDNLSSFYQVNLRELMT